MEQIIGIIGVFEPEISICQMINILQESPFDLKDYDECELGIKFK